MSMSDGKWRGTDKPGGARFFAGIPVWQGGCNCPWPGCYGTLARMVRDAKTLKVLRVACDECGRWFDRDTLLQVHKIDVDKFNL